VRRQAALTSAKTLSSSARFSNQQSSRPALGTEGAAAPQSKEQYAAEICSGDVEGCVLSSGVRRRQHLQPRAVDLNAVSGGMGEILARTIGTTIQVRTNLAPELWPALFDPTQIEIAILKPISPLSYEL
jgi:hypothetical protein